MFGYIKPETGVLLVREYELYKAVYCGICHSIGKNVSHLLRIGLSYDFVCLALIRAALTGESFEIKKRRCFLHPFVKRKTSAENSAVEYTSLAALVLALAKLDDDIADADKPWLRRLFMRPARGFLRGRLKKIAKKRTELSALYESVGEALGLLAKLEKAGCESPDEAAMTSAKMLAAVFSYGLEGNKALLANELGDFYGRIVYYFDALDDFRRDERSGAYNPLNKKFGCADGVIKNIEETDIALSMYISRTDRAAALLPESDATNIIRNISSRGLSAELFRIRSRAESALSGKKGKRARV